MQLRNVVESFGEVDVEKQGNGQLKIKAYILQEPDFENVGMGLALDGSASMKKSYGSGIGIFTSDNIVEPVARTMLSYLAKFSYTGKVNFIYWACGPGGSTVEELGEFDGQEIQKAVIAGPQNWGTGTQLLPPLQYFIKKFQNSPALGVKEPAAICVLVTDGIIEDLSQVKQYCCNYAQEINRGQKPFIKLVLIGVGEQVDSKQMAELDDMFEDNPVKDNFDRDIDLWDHQLVKDMTQLEQVFKELVSDDMIIISSGRILNQQGKVCKEYPDGVPALLEFTLPSGSTSFTLEFPTGSVTQDISEAL